MTDVRPALPARPRILVVGAGVLGTLYAARFALAGFDVTVAERSPERSRQVRDEGLVIEQISDGARQVARVEVIDEISPDSDHDIAIVIARKTHLASILDTLTGTRIPHLLFMMSNAGGPQQLLDAVGERAILGFPGAGGSRDGSLVRYSIPPAFMQKTMLAETDDSRTERLTTLHALFASAGFATETPKSMDGWMKSHEAFVASIGNATYAAGGDGAALASDRDLLALNVRAIREVHRALDASGTPVTPSWFRSWDRLPLWFILATYGRFVGSDAWKLGTDQLLSMRDEVEVITQELLEFASGAGVDAVALRTLADRRDHAAT